MRSPWVGRDFTGGAFPGLGSTSTVTLSLDGGLPFVVEGDLIGGDDPAYDSTVGTALDRRQGMVYRADVTDESLLSPGFVSHFQVIEAPFSPNGHNGESDDDGVAMVAIIENGSAGNITIYDGRDFVYHGNPAPYQTSAPITYTLLPSDQIRPLSIYLMAADIGRIGGVVRPNRVDITFNNGAAPISYLPGFDDQSYLDPEFDILKKLNILIPAGVTQVTVSVSSVQYEDDDPLSQLGLNPASVIWIFAGFVLDEMPDTEECEECDGKVTDLVFKYDGDAVNPTITVGSKRGPSTVGVSVVNMGNNLYFIKGPETGNGGFYGTLGTEINVYVNGEFNANFHTSCSQPIGPGLKHGDILLIEGTSKNGGALCPVEDDPETPEDPTDCECEGKVSNLELAYNGPAVNGDIAFILKKGNDVFMAPFQISTDGTFLVSPASGADNLGTDVLIVLVKGDNITPLAQFHTSCSQPIGAGAFSGNFEVVSGASKDGGVLCDLPSPYEHELNTSKFHLPMESQTTAATTATTTKKVQKRGKK